MTLHQLRIFESVKYLHHAGGLYRMGETRLPG